MDLQAVAGMEVTDVRVGSFSDGATGSIPWPQALSWEALAALQILFSPSGAGEPLRGPKGCSLKPGELRCNCSWRRLWLIFVQDLKNKAASDRYAVRKAGIIADSHWGMRR